ncbi:uncharacterized protein LOC106171533 [Lingula anatina]|uniref:Uncharacterized protein LOC106171533 n=1 Tax=Lingula anatina TaxID=7574 RepID=A0A1S3JB07_LINAN|nr:uncharacterized protein LOC106171533 [Lingula anatina]|eukprot:XP_013407381.1 uncharacterized protein LOC106171533 [Lingula anatina]
MWEQALCIIMLIGTSSTSGTVSGRPPDIIAVEGGSILLRSPRSFSGNVASVIWDLDHSSQPTQIAEWNPGGEPEVHAPLNKEQDKLVPPSGDLLIGKASKSHGGVYTCRVTDAKHVEWNSRCNVEVYDKGQRTIQVKGLNTQVLAAYGQQLEINLVKFSQERLTNEDVWQVRLTLKKDNVSEDLLHCFSNLSSAENFTCDLITEEVIMQNTGTTINLGMVNNSQTITGHAVFKTGVHKDIIVNIVTEQPGLTTLEPEIQDVTGSTPKPKLQNPTSPATPSIGTNLIVSIKIIFCLVCSGLGIMYLASN